MTNWNNINCRTDCGRCNHIGKPSNMKGSKNCLQLRKEISVDKDNAFLSFFKIMFKKKGFMRATGKTYEQNQKDEGEKNNE